jgi:hypothetical protein
MDQKNYKVVTNPEQRFSRNSQDKTGKASYKADFWTGSYIIVRYSLDLLLYYLTQSDYHFWYQP